MVAVNGSNLNIARVLCIERGANLGLHLTKAIFPLTSTIESLNIDSSTRTAVSGTYQRDLVAYTIIGAIHEANRTAQTSPRCQFRAPLGVSLCNGQADWSVDLCCSSDYYWQAAPRITPTVCTATPSPFADDWGCRLPVVWRAVAFGNHRSHMLSRRRQPSRCTTNSSLVSLSIH